MTRFCIFISALLLWMPLQANEPIKVACVGNSVTYGAGLAHRDQESYPVQLQQLLGEEYIVENFGHSGTTLLRKGHRPYNSVDEYRKALDFKADIVIIHLGLNDTDPRNWPIYRDQFVGDYLQLIQDFRQANEKARIYICRMTPITSGHKRFLSGTRDWYHQIQHAIEQVAIISNVPLIDLNKPLYAFPNLFPDNIHPNVEGAHKLANTVYQAITGNFGGLQLPAVFSSGMVLPRQRKIVLSGTANAGVRVSLALSAPSKSGNQGRQKPFQAETTASAQGEWHITLPETQAGGPYTLRLSTSQKESLLLSDIYFGEVWLCSGQSNMAFMVNESVETEQKTAQTYAANNTLLRIYDQKPYQYTDDKLWSTSALDSTNKLIYFKPTQWELCNTKNVGSLSAVAFHFGRKIADSLQVPVGLIINAIGGSPIESWIDRLTLEYEMPQILGDWKHNPSVDSWVRSRAIENSGEEALMRHPYQPCYLFEAGVQPLAHYPISGAIWYQGESNANNVEIHEKLFHLLLESWRRFFPAPNQKESLPFYYVQLTSIDRPSWPRFRDSQRRLMNATANTGMAVSYDWGDSLNVHPRHKEPIGTRLALWALARTYGYQLIPSGPLYQDVRFEGNVAWITFEYGHGMKASGAGPILGFEVAQEEGLFYPADSVVVEGNQVRVSSSRVAHPRFVRYAWQPFTRANLVNACMLPASPFTTETESNPFHTAHNGLD